ncbi:hypothetical protein [Streptomyces silvensis]|uniref:Uncharacterized protein n=1 Tax=Streptomyces silvensis TaxID=1765722 RepID=A0A0W7WWT2_9ACTN|nr:hypothetical protein [Streptomyces silvensis]KUF15043.1 hypothetical protein AT728_26590 [Streptomyces silvensis]
MLGLLALGVSGIAAIGVLVALFSLLAVALPGRPQMWTIHLMRRSALLLSCVAATVYFMGMFWLEVAVNESLSGTDSAPSPSCRQDAPVAIEHISGYEVRYLPLRFECFLDNGASYASSEFPTWLTALPAVLAPAAALLALGARHLTRRRTP